MDVPKLARRAIKSSRKVVVCLRCRKKLQFRFLVDHALVEHQDIDVNDRCIFCLRRFRDNRFEKHFKSCFNKRSVIVKMMCRQKDGSINTATAKRVLNAECSTRQSIMSFETTGKLPSVIEWEHATNLTDLTKRPVIIKNPADKEIIVTQEDRLETLRMATEVLLSFAPRRWYHLIVSQKHVSKLQDLLRGRSDMFVPDFGSWCKSPSLLSQEKVQPDKVLHYHMLLYTENPEWKKEIWKPLVSNDRNRYKVYRAIDSPKHLSNVLHYISQSRPCGKDGTKHFDIQRPIWGKLELFTKLVNPVVYLEEIHNLMSTNIANFDLYKTYDHHNHLTYYTPLKAIMEQIEHFNIPIVNEYRLKLDTNIDVHDFTLTYTQDGRYVNLVPAESSVTVADVLNLMYPDMNVVWSRKLHTVAHNMFMAAQDRCPRCYPVECGIKPLKFNPIEKSGEIVLTFAIKRFRNVVQVALFGRNTIILNTYVTCDGKPPHIYGTRPPAMSSEQLKEYLSYYFKSEKSVTLIAKNEKPFDYLKTLLAVPNNVTPINADPILKGKFKNKKDLEQCAETVDYDDYDPPDDAGYEAKLLYELLSLDVN